MTGEALIGRQYIEPVLFSRLLSSSPFRALPSQCAICRGWDAQRVCAGCVERFARAVPRCEQCALRVPDGTAVCGECLQKPRAFDGARAGVDYAYPWDALVLRMKFRSALDLTQALAPRLADAVKERPRPDCLLPVPLSNQRLRQRGYNQAWEITRRLSKALNVPADSGLLLRIKDTPHQLTQAVDHRGTNVQGAFAVEPLRRHELAGRSVAIVDDVMTTGATCDEIARVLRQAGVRHVEAWVVARTPRAGSA